MKVNKLAVIRTIILFISLLNIALEIFGIKALPVDNDLVYDAVSVAILIGSTISAWWKNNSFTKPAIQADEYLKNLKEK